MTVQSLGYVRWQSRNMPQWQEFATKVLGLMSTDGAHTDSLYFRTDDRPYRLEISPGDNTLGAVGFEVIDDIDLDSLVEHLTSLEVDVSYGTSTEARARQVTGYAYFDDVDGNRIELYYGPILTHEPIITPLVSSFVTGDMGMGHVVLGTSDAARSEDFYRKALGFRRRNTFDSQIPGSDERIQIRFLGCNQRHHTVAFAEMPVEGRLQHIMFEVGTIDDVGLAYDRCLDSGIEMALSIGRHTNDKVISFYCISPDGPMIEIGWGGVRVTDPDAETTYQITSGEFWGHRPPSA